MFDFPTFPRAMKIYEVSYGMSNECLATIMRLAVNSGLIFMTDPKMYRP